MISCLECGQSFKMITWRHLRKHDMTVREYMRKHDAPVNSAEHLHKLTTAGSKTLTEFTRSAEGRALHSRISSTRKQSDKEIHKRALTVKRRWARGEMQCVLEGAKEHWLHTEANRQNLKRMLAKQLQYKQNGLEKYFEKDVVAAFDLPYRYVGNGQWFIGGRVPDFIHNRKKLTIELFGNHWHKPEEVLGRSLHFAKYGWDTLVLWESEVNSETPESLAQRVRTYEAESAWVQEESN